MNKIYKEIVYKVKCKTVRNLLKSVCTTYNAGTYFSWYNWNIVESGIKHHKSISQMHIIVAKEIWYFVFERINYNICFWKAEVQTYP